jgi:hypothetical protein
LPLFAVEADHFAAAAARTRFIEDGFRREPWETLVSIALNLAALMIGFVSALLLTFGLDPVVSILARAASPNVVNVGRGPDMNAISQLGMEIRTGAEKSRRRVRLGCIGLGISFALQAIALFL